MNNLVSNTDKIYQAFATVWKDEYGYAPKDNVKIVAESFGVTHNLFYRNWKKIKDNFEVKKKGRKVWVRCKRVDYPTPEISHEMPLNYGNAIIKSNSELEKALKEIEALKEMNKNLADKMASVEHNNEVKQQIIDKDNLIQTQQMQMQSLSRKLVEANNLIIHYEKTLAIVIARKLEQGEALSSN